MTDVGKRLGRLINGSGDLGRRGARRRNLMAFVVSVLGHALLVARLHHDSPPPQAATLPDVAGMSVSLVSSTSETTKAPLTPTSPTQAVAPDQIPPKDPTPQPAEPESVSPTNPLQQRLPPLDPTAEPIALTQPAAPAPTSSAATPAAAAAGVKCNPAGALEAAIQANSQIMADLPRIPRSAKPVADTLTIWNDRWLPIAAPGFAGTSDSLRRTITDIVRGLSPDCRTQPVMGPRLLFIADHSGTTVIALGTGSWVWADLLREPADASRVETNP